MKTTKLAFIIFVGCISALGIWFGYSKRGQDSLGFESINEGKQMGTPPKTSEKILPAKLDTRIGSDIQISNGMLNTASLTFKQKLNNESLLNEEYSRLLHGEVVTLSDAVLLERLLNAGVHVPEDLAQRMRSGNITEQDHDDISILVFSSRPEEEAFLDDAKDFHQLVDAAKERRKITGKFYGNKVLEHPIAYKNSKFSDITEVISEGATLPDDALSMMVMQNNLALAEELKKNGYELNSDYVNPRNGMTVIESFLDAFVIFPDGDGAQSAISTIDTLLELGVPSQVDNGTRDALDILLAGALNQQSEESARIIAKVGEMLLQRDFKLTRSHEELLAQTKEKYGDLFSNYLH